MKGQYVIIDLRNMEFMKDYWGHIIHYDTEEEAREPAECMSLKMLG